MQNDEWRGVSNQSSSQHSGASGGAGRSQEIARRGVGVNGRGPLTGDGRREHRSRQA
jgi:hypothetical protein